MPNEITYNSSQIIGYLLGAIGSLLIFGGVLCGYIWKRHVSDNDCKFRENKEDHDIYDSYLRDRKHK